MPKKRIRVGIIGLGYVGGAVRAWFERNKAAYDLFFYDKFKNIGSIEDVNKADIVFVAVPTPYLKGKGYDDSAVRESLRNIHDGKIAVIKSTVMPRSTEHFQKHHPKKIILFNPEFLVAKTANRDFIKPERQIMGYANPRGRAAASKVLSVLPKAPYVRIMKSTEAELVKYFGNAFLAARVIFANQFFDICRAADVDYDVVKDGASHDPRIGSSHFNVMADGYRGYGGPCLPKDVRALAQFAHSVRVKTDLLDALERVNKKLGQR